MDVKLSVVRLKTSLHDLSEFAEGTLGNAVKTEDKSELLEAFFPEFLINYLIFQVFSLNYAHLSKL